MLHLAFYDPLEDVISYHQILHIPRHYAPSEIQNLRYLRDRRSDLPRWLLVWELPEDLAVYDIDAFHDLLPPESLDFIDQARAKARDLTGS